VWGAGQFGLCRVPYKTHSATPPALGKEPNSGSEVLVPDGQFIPK
jgi:hypothetical protein